MERINTTGWGRMDYVHFYTEKWGCPVIPINEDKKPAVHWVQYQTAMPTEEELNRWFVLQKAWGLAIILKHHLFSIDMDTDELFLELKQQGAFPKGACIYKSARGYHVIMRGKGELYGIAEHSKDLIAINPLFDQLSINVPPQLSIMPDTPKREWRELYSD